MSYCPTSGFHFFDLKSSATTYGGNYSPEQRIVYNVSQVFNRPAGCLGQFLGLFMPQNQNIRLAKKFADFFAKNHQDIAGRVLKLRLEHGQS
jgi:hypothetical protein